MLSHTDQRIEPKDIVERMIVGVSASTLNVIALVRQIARYPFVNVLIQGESGTGKEVVARAIHAASHGASGQFMDLNCAAIPETLFEAELFGVEAGAFTDATDTREGYLLRAHGGTLFLDEIGAMPLVLQAKLLRFLETRRLRRVGSTKEMHVDLRVISATNLDLQSAVAQKMFREDLLYRLRVITVHLLPLRQRPEDIELLVEHFLRMESAASDKDGTPLRISPEALELLQCYSWPGNVRELRSAIQHGHVLCDDNVILPKDLPENVRCGRSRANAHLHELLQQLHLPREGVNLRDLVSTIERRFVQEALEYCQGNQVHAAALLRISRDQLRHRKK